MRSDFVATAHRQRSELPDRLGCAFLEDCTVQVNDFGQTSVPGVYAAGDCGSWGVRERTRSLGRDTVYAGEGVE